MPAALLVLVAAFLSFGAAPAAAAFSSTAVPTIGTNGTVDTLVQGNGQLFLGGTFNRVGTPDRSLAALSTSTGMNTPGFPQTNGVVYAMVPDGSGGFYVGGTFTVIGGVGRNRLAHITSSGAVDGFNPDLDLEVRALALSGTTLYAGGSFTSVNTGSTFRTRLAAFDTTKATGNVLPFNPNVNNPVTALALSGTTLYVGGSFTGANSVNGNTTRNRLAAFDTTKATANVLPFDPDVGDNVNALVLSGTTLYAGGTFTSVNGATTRNRVAAFDTTQATANVLPFDPNLNADVASLALSGTTLYAGGDFAGAGSVNGSATRNRLAAFDTTKATANVLPFDPNVSGRVDGLALSGTTLYAGGAFAGAGSVNGTTVRNRLAAFDTTKAIANVLPFDPDSDGRVFALMLSGTVLYAGGGFTFAGGADDVVRNNLASIAVSTGAVTAFDPNPNVRVSALALSGTTLYAGGNFNTVNGTTSRLRLAAFDTTQPTANVLPFNPGVRGPVLALVLSGTTLYAGGAFSGANSVNGTTTRNRLAAFDTTQATANVLPFDPNFNGAVNDLLLSGSTLYVGGAFNGAGSVNGTTTRNRLAALDTTQATANVLPFDPNLSADANALLLSGTTLYVGGNFNGATAVNGTVNRSQLAAFDITKATANVRPFNPFLVGSVNALALSGTTILAGGGGNGARPGLAAFDTTQANPSVLPFNPNLNSAVSALLLTGSTLYVGGAFTSAGGTVAPGVAKFVDQAATAVRWRGGAARALTGRRGVRVTWSTGLETNNLGFDVLRIRRGHHTQVRVTRKLILGGALSRRSYRFTDTTGHRGDRYYVIDRDLRGHATIHPVGAAA